jgi:hypothetical protein
MLVGFVAVNSVSPQDIPNWLGCSRKRLRSKYSYLKLCTIGQRLSKDQLPEKMTKAGVDKTMVMREADQLPTCSAPASQPRTLKTHQPVLSQRFNGPHLGPIYNMRLLNAKTRQLREFLTELPFLFPLSTSLVS